MSRDRERLRRTGLIPAEVLDVLDLIDDLAEIGLQPVGYRLGSPYGQVVAVPQNQPTEWDTTTPAELVIGPKSERCARITQAVAATRNRTGTWEGNARRLRPTSCPKTPIPHAAGPTRKRAPSD